MVRMRARGRVRFADDPEPEDPWGNDEQQNIVQAPVAPPPQQIPLPPQPLQQRQPLEYMRRTEPALPHPRRNTALTQAVLSALRSSSPPASDRGSTKQNSTVSISSTSVKSQRYPTIPRRPEQQKQQLPSLQKLCLGVLGRHVVQLVTQLDGQLGFLPAEVKAALLAVARRRGELTSRVLSSLADPEWTLLDLSHCKQLCAAEVLQAAPLMPNIQVLDVTGFDQLAAGGWKQLARAWPSLSVLRLGGSQTCSQEALKALPYILPGIPQQTAAAAAAAGNIRYGGSAHVAITSSSSQNGANAAEQAAAAAEEEEEEDDDQGLGSWEDAYNSDNDEENDTQQEFINVSARCAASSTVTSSPTSSAFAAAGQDCRLKKLQALIWPDVPAEAVDLVQRRCPKVLINPPMKEDKVTGELPPRQLDGSVALDQPFVELVGPEALQGIISNSPSPQQQNTEVVLSIADKFAMAYIQQANRLRDKEWRLRQQEQRRQLRSSHALRTMEKWLDEPA